MIGIIQNQTKWYLQKASQLDKVTIQLMDLHPDGRHRMLHRLNKAFHMAKFIMDLSRSACIAFGNSLHDNEPFEKAGNALDSAQELVNSHYRSKEYVFPPSIRSQHNNHFTDAARYSDAHIHIDNKYTKDNLYNKFWEKENDLTNK